MKNLTPDRAKRKLFAVLARLEIDVAFKMVDLWNNKTPVTAQQIIDKIEIEERHDENPLK